MRVHLVDALGSYPNREEFQVGRVIVWVLIPAQGNRNYWLERGDLLFEEIWQAVPAVVEAARQESRVVMPEFWKAHGETGTVGEQLAVYGIWIDPTTGSADYEVGSSIDFDTPDGLPEWPEHHCIMVSRDPAGSLMARGVSW